MTKPKRKLISFLCLCILITSCDSGSIVTSIPTEVHVEATIPIQSTPTITNVDILEQAIHNLQDAASLKIVTSDIRAYEATLPNQISQLIYGEDHREYSVINTPQIKVKCSLSFRYSPDDDFSSTILYYWQEDQNFFIQEMTQDSSTQRRTISADQIEPFAGDVYQTLIQYYQEAQFIDQEGNIAEYKLIHPAWYKLSGAVGFANLGLFLGMENSELMIQQYLADHFQNVTSPIFTIYVDTESRFISKVSVDDRDFMTSIWASIDMELLKQGGENQTLTKYEVLDTNSSEYFFSRYNQVTDFTLPPMD